MSSFDVKTTGEEVVKAFASVVKGKTFIITGGSLNSLGAQTALALAPASPSTIILLGRTESKVTPVLENIRAINPTISTSFVKMDLTSTDSVKKAATEILHKAPKIDVLMNSAGIMAVPYSTITMPSGLPVENHLATNHLGHFLFTALLLPALYAAPSPRIVNITSTAFELTTFSFTNYNFDDGKTYNPWTGYGQSKTANNLFTVSLSQKLDGIKAFVVHPGMVNETGIGKDVAQETWNMAWEWSKANNVKPPTPKNLQAGCATGLVAALDPELDGKSGSYLIDCIVSPSVDHASNPELADELWVLSEKLIGEKFEL